MERPRDFRTIHTTNDEFAVGRFDQIAQSIADDLFEASQAVEREIARAIEKPHTERAIDILNILSNVTRNARTDLLITYAASADLGAAARAVLEKHDAGTLDDGFKA
jgi:hypothetical protein